MATITIKNIPDSVHGALKERALRNGRSLNGEVVSCLQSVVAVPQIDVTKVLQSVDKIRVSDSVRLDTKLLEKALSEGRP
ncbi:MAG: plasmid stability protein [Verrucomicrobia bacterium]|nr:plasmid stability protein [Verrucomicrobiota bacterium]MDA1066463.1 plasmid stability protein [Verrucomicrobiota bacterium]